MKIGARLLAVLVTGVIETEGIEIGAIGVEEVEMIVFELGYIAVEGIKIGVIETPVTGIGVIEL